MPCSRGTASPWPKRPLPLSGLSRRPGTCLAIADGGARNYTAGRVHRVAIFLCGHFRSREDLCTRKYSCL